jgi:hypothetical protein
LGKSTLSPFPKLVLGNKGNLLLEDLWGRTTKYLIITKC